MTGKILRKPGTVDHGREQKVCPFLISLVVISFDASCRLILTNNIGYSGKELRE
jgi:hypothetical protein